ncbi:hypothetical protein BGZ46_004945, partial [Entomortierella lignicola]
MKFQAKSGLRKHFGRKHVKPEEVNSEIVIKMECSQCKTKFLSTEALDEHLDTHANVYEDTTHSDEDVHSKEWSDFNSLPYPEAEQEAVDPAEGWNRISLSKTPMEVKPNSLEMMLISHRYGLLIDVKRYKAIDPRLFVKSFKTHRDEIAKQLSGSIIQTGTQLILIVKAEVYGREPSDDPHGFNQVMPSWDLKKISVVFHDN